MKNKTIILLASSLCLSGCSSRKEVLERGWIGGAFANVQHASKWKTSDDKTLLLGLPRELDGKFKRAIFVSDIDPESPLARGGVEKGDLILAVNNEPVDSVIEFHRSVDAAPPGSKLSFTTFRDGVQTERSVLAGREKFRVVGTVTAGLGFKTKYEADLYPNPDFSLIALGFKNNHERINLSDPRIQYLQKLQPSEAQPSEGEFEGRKSPEGWRAWLVIFELAKHKRIISQEIAETPAQTAAIR